MQFFGSHIAPACSCVVEAVLIPVASLVSAFAPCEEQQDLPVEGATTLASLVSACSVLAALRSFLDVVCAVAEVMVNASTSANRASTFFIEFILVFDLFLHEL